jgi:hypothetical protein
MKNLGFSEIDKQGAFKEILKEALASLKILIINIK